MRLLLDTHVFLWWSEDNPRLDTEARTVISDADRVFISVASAWEVAIKSALGKLKIQVPFERAININRFSKLLIEFPHASAVAKLATHHRDPFDRMLIAQAQVEELTVITHDRRFEPYRVPVIWT